MRFSAVGAMTDCRNPWSGPPAPGIGFAIGEDRLVLVAAGDGRECSKEAGRLRGAAGPGMNLKLRGLARELRGENLVVESRRRRTSG